MIDLENMGEVNTYITVLLKLVFLSFFTMGLSGHMMPRDTVEKFGDWIDQNIPEQCHEK